MAGQRLRTGNARAMLQFWGINSTANQTEKPPDLCFNDFLESVSSTGALKAALKGYGKKSLTSTQATNLLTVPLPAGGAVAFLVRATIIATDGTDIQAFTEMLQIVAVNKATTVTKTLTNLSTTGAKAVSGGTLTTSWALSDAGVLSVTPTTSLTATALDVYFTIENVFPPSATAPVFA